MERSGSGRRIWAVMGRTYAAVLLVFLVVSGSVAAQSPSVTAPPNALFQTIARLDSTFFDAYNRCDLKTVETMVAPDLEFYHDQSGLALGRQTLVDDLQKYICGKVRRELVAASMEVYPLKGYGAVQIGVHRFHHPGRDDVEPVGEAKFITIWHEQNGVWQMARVISFDHAAMK